MLANIANWKVCDLSYFHGFTIFRSLIFAGTSLRECEKKKSERKKQIHGKRKGRGAIFAGTSKMLNFREALEK